MTTHNQATNQGSPIARPLQVLVPLIEDDLENGTAAAERAALPYYRAAGEKLLEAKAQLDHGEFTAWVKRHFALSIQTARRYMALAEQTAGQNESAVSFSSLSDFIRKTSDPNYNRRTSAPSIAATRSGNAAADGTRVAGAAEDVFETWSTEQRSRQETDRLGRWADTMKQRADEREAQRALALRLIDVGYKALARELHPDKGGSREVMVRLNAVRDRLKQCV
jgi:hypothetical protein